MKIFLVIVVSFIILIIAAFFYLGVQSKSAKAAGLNNGQLSRCPDKPNCICSEYNDDPGHFTLPLSSNLEPEIVFKHSLKAITAMNGVVTEHKQNYIAATFTSAIFGFVDDFEIRIDADQALVHIRSASRVGHSDLGANRKRVDAFKNRFQQTN